MTNQDLLELGFKELPHKTIGNIVTYDLGRERSLSASDVGNPNEMVYICQATGKQIEDAVCIHNYDYDGYMTKEQVIAWIDSLSHKVGRGQVEYSSIH
jgi:hypothetical protein